MILYHNFNQKKKYLILTQSIDSMICVLLWFIILVNSKEFAANSSIYFCWQQILFSIYRNIFIHIWSHSVSHIQDRSGLPITLVISRFLKSLKIFYSILRFTIIFFEILYKSKSYNLCHIFSSKFGTSKKKKYSLNTSKHGTSNLSGDW